MVWREAKIAFEWVIAPLLVALFYVPWGTLIRWAKEEVEPRKDVV